ncbi:hypothetical protein J437_LFUL018393 [Ladona fulva]|uniref:Telomerase RNA component interacting RNase n=1 Tax=Ladona fulva TaxID=123851 RepID=A0A8K0KQU2_LADFU|nr:hypothetical protein J437_LFUL018393 [Ladona fulva]
MAESDSYESSSSSDSDDSSPSKKDLASNQPKNIFKNDGSFLKMFQLLQKESNSESAASSTETPPAEASPPSATASAPSTVSQSSSQTSSEQNTSSKDPAKKKSLMSFVGKRRGGKVLPTGVVKKQRKDDPVREGNPKDAWSQYMEEVRKYKELSCEEEEKTRPLVK